MRREEARALARALMDAHGLGDWVFRFDRARRRAGSCVHATHTITLSAVLVDLYDDDTVRGVVLHEVAHALAGPSHHHDAEWRRRARALGAPDTSRLPGSLPSPQAPWVGSCPRCARRRELFSAPRRVVSCGVCAHTFTPELVLRWCHNGVPTTPGGAYARELRRLRLGGRIRASDPVPNP